MNTIIILAVGAVIGMGTAYFAVAITNTEHNAEIMEALERSTKQTAKALKLAEQCKKMYWDTVEQLAAANAALAIEKKKNAELQEKISHEQQ